MNIVKSIETVKVSHQKNLKVFKILIKFAAISIYITGVGEASLVNPDFDQIHFKWMISGVYSLIRACKKEKKSNVGIVWCCCHWMCQLASNASKGRNRLFFVVLHRDFSHLLHTVLLLLEIIEQSEPRLIKLTQKSSKNTMRTCTISDVKLMCHTHYDTFWEHFLFGTRDQSEINQIEWETITNVCSKMSLQLKIYHQELWF